MLRISANGGKKVPEVLEKGARELGGLLGNKNKWRAPSAAIAIPRTNGVLIPADLRLARTRNDAPFVVAELEDPEGSPRLAEIAVHYRLTKAETDQP